MKKILLILALFCFTACSTVLSGRADKCQKIKPAAGQPMRQVRVGYLIADILLFPIGLIPDFATGTIYKPCK